MIDGVFLCRVIYTRGYGRVEVIAERRGLTWFTREFHRDLPPEGKLFSPNLADFAEGQILTCGIAQNPRRDKPDQDAFLVDQPLTATEVFDFRISGPDRAREDLFENGIELHRSGNQEVVVAISERECCKVQMQFDGGSGKHFALKQNLEQFPVYPINSTFFTSKKVENRYFAVPNLVTGAVISRINWLSDQDFLELVLKRIRRAHSGAPFSRNDIQGLARFLSEIDVLSTFSTDWEETSKRAARLVAAVESNLETLFQVADLFSKSPSVLEKVENRRAELEQNLKEELRPHVKQLLEGENTELQKQKSVLIESIQSLEEKASQTKSQCEKTLSELKTAKDLLNRTYDGAQNVIDAITANSVRDASKISDALAEHVPSAQGKISHPLSPPWSREGSREAVKELPIEELHEAVKKLLTGSNVSAEDLLALDAIARSGNIPLLLGPSGVELASLYANLAAGGQLVREMLNPATICMDDLWRSSASSEITGFAKSWLQAQNNPERTYIVLLENINNSPLDFWLPSLEKTVHTREYPKNLIVLASICGAFVDSAHSISLSSTSMIPVFCETGEADTKSFLASHSATPTKYEIRGDRFRAEDLAGFSSKVLPFLESESCIEKAYALFTATSMTLSQELSIKMTLEISNQKLEMHSLKKGQDMLNQLIKKLEVR